MKVISLLPADKYVVINKTILTEIDKKNLINLYEPIIGDGAVSLYLTLWSDLDKTETMSIDFSHHHLMTILKKDLDNIRKSRECLEAVGLLKTYIKQSDINEYVYELYSPLSPAEFFNHPIFNIVLYNNVGKFEYELLKKQYEKIKVDLKDYEDITKKIKDTFETTSHLASFDVKERTTALVDAEGQIDFDLLLETIPPSLINERTLNKKTKALLNNLSYVYNIDTLKMCELLRVVINGKGCLDKEELRKTCRKYYQYNNGGLPTLIYRSQPEYLKSPTGDNTKRGKIIAVFENTSPYDFLKSKYNGTTPTQRDLRLLENLLIDVELNPAVVNVLIDYVLKKNNNKLTTALVETIAGQWKRAKITTAKEAMEFAEKEHKKATKKVTKGTNQVNPEWFDKENKKQEISETEEQELKDLLKEFR
ncbi:MAG: DnaD domain protein [Bacilli bacterium]|nr:DnaD domain protein [Bacilli bacterium]